MKKTSTVLSFFCVISQFFYVVNVFGTYRRSILSNSDLSKIFKDQGRKLDTNNPNMNNYADISKQKIFNNDDILIRELKNNFSSGGEQGDIPEQSYKLSPSLENTMNRLLSPESLSGSLSKSASSLSTQKNPKMDQKTFDNYADISKQKIFNNDDILIRELKNNFSSGGKQGDIPEQSYKLSPSLENTMNRLLRPESSKISVSKSIQPADIFKKESNNFNDQSLKDRAEPNVAESSVIHDNAQQGNRIRVRRKLLAIPSSSSRSTIVRRATKLDPDIADLYNSSNV